MVNELHFFYFILFYKVIVFLRKYFFNIYETTILPYLFICFLKKTFFFNKPYLFIKSSRKKMEIEREILKMV